jgi:hypothetical protein
MGKCETITGRILEYIQSKGITPGKFERSIDAGNNYLNNVKSIGSDKLTKIIEVYPDLNVEWLLTGKGTMTKDATATSARDSVCVNGVAQVSGGHENSARIYGTHAENNDEEVSLLKQLLEEKERTIQILLKKE